MQLGAATRLQGITPAAVVHLLNYVRHTGQKERRPHRYRTDQREDEKLRARNTSLPR